MTGSKKVYTGIVFILLIIFLNGCAPKVIELTDKDNELVAEYVSSLLLRYDKHYTNPLDYKEIENQGLVEEEQAESAEEEDNGVGDDGGLEEKYTGVDDGEPADETMGEIQQPEETMATPVPLVELSKIYEDFGIQVSYTKCHIDTEYMEDGDSLVFMPDKKNNKLLIMNFKVNNTLDQENKINLMSKSIQYIVQSQQGEYSAMQAILDNGLNVFDETLPKKGTKKAMLLFEVPNDFKIEEAMLKVIRGNDMANVSLN